MKLYSFSPNTYGSSSGEDIMPVPFERWLIKEVVNSDDAQVQTTESIECKPANPQ